jgi:uncharacterized membrane protein
MYLFNNLGIISTRIIRKEFTMAKSAAFGVVHLGVAFSIGYALTGDVAIAGAITLIEPAVNTVVHYAFDRWWGHPALRQAWARSRAAVGAPLRARGGPAAAA